MDLLKDPAICAALDRAWRESQADDPTQRHEEGGFVVRNDDGSYGIERWPQGGQSRIVPPSLDADRCYNGRAVVAAFHTHPNPPIDELGREWEQGPSESDCRWHARRKLPGIVVSRALVYGMDTSANVSVLGKHEEVFPP
jgi:hypothetical protein